MKWSMALMGAALGAGLEVSVGYRYTNPAATITTTAAAITPRACLPRVESRSDWTERCIPLRSNHQMMVLGRGTWRGLRDGRAITAITPAPAATAAAAVNMAPDPNAPEMIPPPSAPSTGASPPDTALTSA